MLPSRNLYVISVKLCVSHRLPFGTSSGASSFGSRRKSVIPSTAVLSRVSRLPM